MFKQIDINDLQIKPYDLIGNQWMLITAGPKDHYNTMTASWGQIGSLWGLPVTSCYVRPQRYTKQFIDAHDYYTLSFYNLSYRKQLSYLGSHSGKDEDKVAKVNFTPTGNDNAVWFEQASLVIVCKKIYQQTIKEDCFVDKSLIEHEYPKRDYHDLYIGQIVKVFVKE